MGSMPFQVRDDKCAVLTDDDMGRGGGDCPQPPTVRAVWRFDQPGKMPILLCDQHADELADHERLTVKSASLDRGYGPSAWRVQPGSSVSARSYWPCRRSSRRRTLSTMDADIARAFLVLAGIALIGAWLVDVVESLARVVLYGLVLVGIVWVANGGRLPW